MKILIVAGLAGPGSVAGGVWSVALHQARRLAESGHQVVIVAGWLGPVSSDDVDRFSSISPRLSVILLSVKPVIPPLGLKFLVSREWRSVVEQQLSHADVLFVHLCRDFMTIRSTLSAPPGMRVVAQTHGMLKKSNNLAFKMFDGLLLGRAISRVNTFICLSPAEADQLADLCSGSPTLVVLPNTLEDPGTRWQQPSPGSIPRLLFASRLHPRKQALLFSRAILELNEEGFYVSGEICGTDEGDLKAISKLQLEHVHGDKVRYLGPLTPNEVRGRMADSSAVVFPVRDEPFGMVAIEALAVGCPLICSDETPIATSLRQAGAAVVAKPTLNCVKQEIRALVRDETRMRELSRAGRALFEQKWSDRQLAKTLLEIFTAETAK